LFLLSGNLLAKRYFTTNRYVSSRQKFPPATRNNAVGKGTILDYFSQVKHAGIYRRRRLGALLAASAAVCVLYASAGADAVTTPVSYTVMPGDTLWEVATEHYPSSEDPRATIEAIRQENGLEGYGLKPGMRLELPR
jgi:LysM repeat protein